MASITLKNIPEELLNELKSEAKINKRSLNSEILFAIQLYLLRKKERPSAAEIINHARAFRNTVKGSLTLEEIQHAIDEGRP